MSATQRPASLGRLTGSGERRPQEEERLGCVPLRAGLLRRSQTTTRMRRGGLGAAGEQLTLATHPGEPDTRSPAAGGSRAHLFQRPVHRAQIGESDRVGDESDQKMRATRRGDAANDRGSLDARRLGVASRLSKN
ncbi:MAG: hypothetical protein E6G68_06330 [Actinobacteria bacterium]|nr:MAG: hypothetical protein E6G68_06330 [Actinomycetota bacterium]